MIIVSHHKSTVPGRHRYICVGMMADLAIVKPWTLAGIGAAAALSVAVWQGLGAPIYNTGAADIAARVNDAEITKADFELAVEAVRRDKRSDISEEDRRRILQTLVNEELLVQRAVDLGLFETDRGVRKAAVDAMLQFAISRADATPSDNDLRKWYEENKNQFLKEDRIRASVVILNSAEASKKFTDVVQNIGFDAAVQQLPGARLLPLPNTLLQPTKMIDYVGPDLFNYMRDLKAGDIAGPYSVEGQRFYFIWLRERLYAAEPKFEDIKETVKAVWTRLAEEKATTEYIGSLWKRADIETDIAEAPQ